MGRRIVAPLGPVAMALIVGVDQAGRRRNPRRNHMLPVILMKKVTAHKEPGRRRGARVGESEAASG